MSSPYSRPYYWADDNTSIETQFVGVKDLIIECSMLDLVRVIHTADVLTARFISSDLCAWLYPKQQNTDGTVTAVLTNAPAKVKIAKILNFEAKVVASVNSVLALY